MDKEKNTDIACAAVTDDDKQPAAETALTIAEDVSVFALGLPPWSIEPPAVVIRRKGRI